jgi:hypothetical protein
VQRKAFSYLDCYLYLYSEEIIRSIDNENIKKCFEDMKNRCEFISALIICVWLGLGLWSNRVHSLGCMGEP